MRLIDADALPKCNGVFSAAVIENAIKNAPTIDAVLVVHGRWEYNPGDNIPYCSECMMPQDSETNYCSYCGAVMDGGEKDAE